MTCDVPLTLGTSTYARACCYAATPLTTTMMIDDDSADDNMFCLFVFFFAGGASWQTSFTIRFGALSLVSSPFGQSTNHLRASASPLTSILSLPRCLLRLVAGYYARGSCFVEKTCVDGRQLAGARCNLYAREERATSHATALPYPDSYQSPSGCHTPSFISMLILPPTLTLTLTTTITSSSYQALRFCTK